MDLSFLGWPFFDADDFHPEANVRKMASGVALDDEDRWPWLDRVGAAARASLDRGVSVVVACSALKHAYRQRLAQAVDGDAALRFVYLKGDAGTIAPRLASRSGHYMPAALLASQFAALEEPTDAMMIDIRQSTETQAAAIAAALLISL